MDYLRRFFERKKRYFRNFPIITLNLDIPVKTLIVNRLTYLTPDYAPKVKLPRTYGLYSLVDPVKDFPEVDPPYPGDEILNEVEEIALLNIPIDNFEELLVNIPLQMQNWVQNQQEAALSALEATVGVVNADIDLLVEGTAMAIGPAQQESPPAEVEDEAPGEGDDVPIDDSVNLHIQELVENAVANVVEEQAGAQHYEGAGVVAGAAEASAGGSVPLERQVGAGDDEVGAGAAEQPAIEAVEEQPGEDVQEPSTSGMSGYSSSGTQADNKRPDDE